MEHDPNCHVEPFQKPFDAKNLSKLSRVKLRVSGMGCNNCVTRVRNALLRLDGVDWVDIDLETGLAHVAYNEQIAAPDQFIQAVSAAGRESHHHYEAISIG